MQEYDVIVVGGGASGMMAAGRAASRGKNVLLIEKNHRLGEKLRITGGGRCNVTNATYDVHAMLANYKKSADFLFSPFSQFGVQDTFTFFESRKLPLVVEERYRSFPKTQSAEDVVNVLIADLQQKNVTVLTGKAVDRVIVETSHIAGVVAGKKTYTAKNYIFSTGGMSHPETGSTGDGFGWLRAIGHTVKDPTPTIVPLKTSDAWSRKAAGVSVDDMKITFFLDGKKRFAKTGRLLFTHFGLSGPLILNAAGAVGDLLEEGAVTASIDLFPGLQINELDAKILAAFDAAKKKMLKNVLSDIIQPGMIPAIAALVPDINFDAPVQSVTKEQRRKILDVLRSLPITVTGLMGFDRAVVADGGVPLEEMDMKTMRSKKVENLFIIGDLLHINRPSGGYSLQLCWTTGWVAGSNA